MSLGVTGCYRAYPEGIRQSGPLGFRGRIDQPAPAASSPGCLPDVGLVLRKSAFAVQSRKARKGVGRTVRGTDVIWWSHQLRNTYPTLFLYQRVFTFSTKIQCFFYNFLAFYFIDRMFHFRLAGYRLRSLGNVSVRLDSAKPVRTNNPVLDRRNAIRHRQQTLRFAYMEILDHLSVDDDHSFSGRPALPISLDEFAGPGDLVRTRAE